MFSVAIECMLEANKLEITEAHKLQRSNTFTLSVNHHPTDHKHTATPVIISKPESHHKRTQFKVPSAISKPRAGQQENRMIMLNESSTSTTPAYRKNATAEIEGKHHVSYMIFSDYCTWAKAMVSQRDGKQQGENEFAFMLFWVFSSIPSCMTHTVEPRYFESLKLQY